MPLERQLAMIVEFYKDVFEVGLPGSGVASLEGPALVLDFAPKDLDAVELRGRTPGSTGSGSFD